MGTTINARIIKAIRVANLAGWNPTRLFLPASMEDEILALGASDLGDDLYSDVNEIGPRKAIEKHGNRLFGLEVVWDASEFRVE